MNTTAILNGGGIRIGLEDNIHFDSSRKNLATNFTLINRINEIAKKLESSPYSPVEVRKMLNLEIK